MIRVTSPSRIHISLIDMNGSLGRVDGGVGLTLRKPDTVVEIEKGEGYPEDINYIIKMMPFRKGFSISLKRRIKPHVGLGSETQLRLSVSAGLHEFYGRKWNVEKLARLVSRGGTSGIGIGAFRSGGFILDGGHYFGKGREKDSFLPSHASRAFPAPTIAHLPFPDWDVILAIPEVRRGLSGKDEADFFSKHCPLPEEEVERLSRIILMKMLPSVALKDIEMFGESINLSKRLGFKAREIQIQPSVIHDLLQDFEKVGYGVSVSSFGPTVFAFSDDVAKTERMKKIFSENYDGEFIKTKAQNSGAKIERF